jgi:hypothetical protein
MLGSSSPFGFFDINNVGGNISPAGGSFNNIFMSPLLNKTAYPFQTNISSLLTGNA